MMGEVGTKTRQEPTVKVNVVGSSDGLGRSSSWSGLMWYLEACFVGELYVCLRRDSCVCKAPQRVSAPKPYERISTVR